jgi:hypothetical protein
VFSIGLGAVDLVRIVTGGPGEGDDRDGEGVGGRGSKGDGMREFLISNSATLHLFLMPSRIYLEWNFLSRKEWASNRGMQLQVQLIYRPLADATIKIYDLRDRRL